MDAGKRMKEALELRAAAATVFEVGPNQSPAFVHYTHIKIELCPQGRSPSGHLEDHAST